MQSMRTTNLQGWPLLKIIAKLAIILALIIFVAKIIEEFYENNRFPDLEKLQQRMHEKEH